MTAMEKRAAALGLSVEEMLNGGARRLGKTIATAAMIESRVEAGREIVKAYAKKFRFGDHQPPIDEDYALTCVLLDLMYFAEASGTVFDKITGGDSWFEECLEQARFGYVVSKRKARRG